jgi:hypothetical protein
MKFGTCVSTQIEPTTIIKNSAARRIHRHIHFSTSQCDTGSTPSAANLSWVMRHIPPRAEKETQTMGRSNACAATPHTPAKRVLTTSLSACVALKYACNLLWIELSALLLSLLHLGRDSAQDMVSFAAAGDADKAEAPAEVGGEEGVRLFWHTFRKTITPTLSQINSTQFMPLSISISNTYTTVIKYILTRSRPGP